MIATLALLAACSAAPQEPVPPGDGLSQLRPGAQELPTTGEAAPAPSTERALYPWITHAPDGRVSANWMQPVEGGGARLLWSHRAPDGTWAAPEQVASGDDWFVNWADHPMHAIDDQGTVVATWLKKVPGSTYSYHVMTSRRAPEGSWSEPARLHEDASPTEHGFVSIAPVAGGGFVLAWLDGRATETGAPMQLRARRILADGRFGPELLVDDRVCDCCATTLTLAVRGQYWLAYRDRSAEEVRDMGLARLRLVPDDELALDTQRLPGDQWVMPGCPVNGPASTNWQGEAAVVWFTAHPDPRIRLSRGGADTVVRSDAGVMGRVSCAVAGDQLAISWLETRRGTTAWWIQFFRLNDGKLRPASAARPIAPAIGARADGFLRLAADGDGVLALWMEPKAQRLKLRRIQPGE